MCTFGIQFAIPSSSFNFILMFVDDHDLQLIWNKQLMPDSVEQVGKNSYTLMNLDIGLKSLRPN